MKPASHRCLFNGDCNFLFSSDYRVDKTEPRYSARVIHDYIDRLADNGVDTVAMNANAQVPWYPSRALPNILTGYRRGDRDFFRGHFPPLDETFTQAMLDRQLDLAAAMLDRYLDLVEAGVDWLAEVVCACRRRGLSPWVSLRMNDAHGASSWEHSFMNCALQRDPRYRLSGRPLNPAEGPRRAWQLLNYGQEEVREYMFRMAREVVEDYGFEGLELDWLRCPFCCEPPASEETLGAMLHWFRRIRALTQGRARRLGRPFPLGLRVPVSLDALLTIGLDVRTLCREGLIDFVSPSNFWQTTWDVPYDRLRSELGDGVALYGVVEDAPNWMFARASDKSQGRFRLLSASPELLRGNVAGKLAGGADGIEFYNFFCSDSQGVPQGGVPGAAYEVLRGITDLENLRGKPKHYALQTAYGYWLFRFFESADQLPAWLEPGGWRRFEWVMCAEPQGRDLSLVVQVVVDRRDPLPAFGVSFNGSWPTFERIETDRLLFPAGRHTRHVPEHTAFNYRLDPALIRDGFNSLVVFDGSEDTDPRRVPADMPVRLVSVEAAVLPPVPSVPSEDGRL